MNDTPIREASVIVAPPDTCANCDRRHVPGQINGHIHTPAYSEIKAFYRCPDCGFVWHVTWRIEPQ